MPFFGRSVLLSTSPYPQCRSTHGMELCTLPTKGGTSSFLLGICSIKKIPPKIFPVFLENLLSTDYLFIKREIMKEETKRKISYKLRGRKKSATHRKNISLAMRRVKRSEEHNKAISEAMKIIWKKRREDKQ